MKNKKKNQIIKQLLTALQNIKQLELTETQQLTAVGDVLNLAHTTKLKSKHIDACYEYVFNNVIEYFSVTNSVRNVINELENEE